MQNWLSTEIKDCFIVNNNKRKFREKKSRKDWNYYVIEIAD